MDEMTMYLIFFIVIAFMYLLSGIAEYYRRKKEHKKALEHISEDSYQKYAKFYGDVVPSDEDFETKVNNILNLISKGERDIKEIAKKCHCTYPECVLKIKYLKNKRLIGDYYIDTDNLMIIPCDKKDIDLLKRYQHSIYKKHLSVNDMANALYLIDPYSSTKEEYVDKVFSDLKYLDDKNLLNGIKLNEVDKTIKYYSIEKKSETNLVSVHCPNCGALNDIDVDSKVRCSYCNTIIIVDDNEGE